MLDASARLLRTAALLASRPSWTGAQLAATLGVSLRTVRRDVTKLRELGYPVQAQPGPEGSYRLGAGADLPPLVLDDGAVVAVVLGLRLASAAGVAGLEDDALRALRAVEQVLPPRLRPQVEAVAATAAVPDRAPVTDPATLTALAGAARDGLEVRLDYLDRRGRRTARRVEPHRVVRAGRFWYLLGWDVDRADWRTFRLDRTGDVHVTTFRVPRREAPDPVTHVQDAVSLSPYRWKARVRVHAPLDRVAERVPPTVATLEPDGEDACVLVTGSDGLDDILAHLVHLGEDVTVLEPPELVDRAREWARRLS